MDSQKLLFSLLILSLLSGQGSADRNRHFRPTKLFVFGDSYADTGNIDILLSSARNFPYGITFPGKPSGRFSDGRVLTDFTAKFFGLKSPIPYSVWEKSGFKKSKLDGINFAFGGTGVFDTSFPFPNMTTQIDFFQKLITDSVFTGNDINSSLALVSVAGNDYSFHITPNASTEGLIPLIISVVEQITVDLKRIHSMGMERVAVTGLGPLGCLPQITASSSFKQCNQTLNLMVQFHNFLLKAAVESLNTQTEGSPFFVLDLFSTFHSIIQGKRRFKNPLKPCCFGVSSEFSCGSVDGKGNKMYQLCRDPKSAFFWDSVHPTQQGWMTAFSSFRSIFN